VLIPAPRKGALPFYRLLGAQALRIDRAEALLREAHGRRVAARNRPFMLDPAPALRMGLSTRAYAHLLRLAGFRAIMPRMLGETVSGPPAPVVWRWQPPRFETAASPEPAPSGGAFAALHQLMARQLVAG
jgi:ATP-dependent RNA helicase SUPV3L1/SUV3